MRQTGPDNALSRPLAQVRADSELALASLLGLGHTSGGARGAQPVRPGVVLGLVFAMALVLALVSLDAVL